VAAIELGDSKGGGAHTLLPVPPWRGPKYICLN